MAAVDVARAAAAPLAAVGLTDREWKLLAVIVVAILVIGLFANRP